MPYIDSDHRPVLDAAIKSVPENLTAGELNYVITRIIDKQLHFHGLSYTVMNWIVGVLECAKLELYRRMLAPYEDEKIKQNGDAYHAQS